MNGHHAAEQEAVERGEHHDGPVAVADWQQHEHDPEQSDHHGEQLQVPQQPHVGHPAADQPASQVGQRQHGQDGGRPVVIHPQAAGERHEEERRDEETRRCKDGEQDVEEQLGLPEQRDLEDQPPFWWTLVFVRWDGALCCLQGSHEGAADAQVELKASDDHQGALPGVGLDEPLEERAEHDRKHTLP